MPAGQQLVIDVRAGRGGGEGARAVGRVVRDVVSEPGRRVDVPGSDSRNERRWARGAHANLTSGSPGRRAERAGLGAGEAVLDEWRRGRGGTCLGGRHFEQHAGLFAALATGQRRERAMGVSLGLILPTRSPVRRPGPYTTPAHLQPSASRRRPRASSPSRRLVPRLPPPPPPCRPRSPTRPSMSTTSTTRSRRTSSARSSSPSSPPTAASSMSSPSKGPR